MGRSNDTVKDKTRSDTWEIRDLALHGLTNAEKYLVLVFEFGAAM